MHKKIRTGEAAMDELRLTQQQLIQRIQEKDIYAKQSEYMLKLEERNRISQEIHDDIGHAITGALIQMEASKAMLKLDQDKAEELLQNAIGITKEGIESIRLTLKNMKPATEHVGINRLKLYIDEFAAKNSIKTAITYQGNLDVILPIQWKVIAENMNEALTNAMKYSDCSKIAVDITVLNKLIKAEVKDDGSGAGKIEKGLGIIGMEERTASIDGKIIVDGKNGFSVTTLLPILKEV
ncbi:histidine kinase [Virgibacillus halophilus]|uniref:histidine kinase n=1 Tax=Tigheibacillus halophilus TaxID=361280 RepID=A0ABU5C8F7_9BACI|nr:histidine kinase [Virgibacillus halophilus]